MKKFTLEISAKHFKSIQETFAIDYGWEWNDNKDFALQLSQWVVMQALDLEIEDLEEEE